MHSFHPDFLARLSFTTDQVAALSALGEARGRQELFVHQQPERLESLRQAAVIESTESSNRIEGITAPRHRIEALVLKPSAPRDRSEQEIAGYRDALSLIHESHAHMPFSVNVLLQLHGMLYRYHHADGGRFKMTDNQIVERRPDGTSRVRFQPTPAAETPGAMAELVEGYQRAARPPALQPLVGVPLAILDFLCIHPFSDGNGRVARLATLLLLYQHGYTVGRYISLERIFEESKESYYETLERSSQMWHAGAHDPHPWLDYFWGAMQRAYSEFEDRVGVLSGGRGSKSELVRDAILRRLGPFAISDIERDCPGVSRELVRLVLRQMRDDGLIELQGRGRGARWLRVQEG
ncbi:MAG: Fic family protein [Myxococcota bacterium]